MSELIMPSRRGFVAGVTSILFAPAICKAEILMPLRGVIMDPKVLIYMGSFSDKGGVISRANDFWVKHSKDHWFIKEWIRSNTVRNGFGDSHYEIMRRSVAEELGCELTRPDKNVTPDSPKHFIKPPEGKEYEYKPSDIIDWGSLTPVHPSYRTSDIVGVRAEGVQSGSAGAGGVKTI